MRPKQKVRSGEFHLGEATLAISLESYCDQKVIGSEAISVRSRVSRDSFHTQKSGSDVIVRAECLVSWLPYIRLRKPSKTLVIPAKLDGWTLPEQESELRHDKVLLGG